MAASVHVWDGSSPLPSGRYGSCGVAGGVLRTARGDEIAHLGCGIQVMRPGLVDHLGLQVGATGRDVLDRYAGDHGSIARHEAATGDDAPEDAEDRLRCVAAGERARCWFHETDYQEPIVRYTVDAAPPAELVEGAEAAAFFASQTITSFHVTIYCH